MLGELKGMIRSRFPGTALRLRMLRDRFFRFELNDRSLKDVFTDYYRKNYWGQTASASGRGSSLEETGVIREKLPRLLEKYGCASLLDVPCGDFHWMSQVDLGGVRYVGADIVDELIRLNAERFGGAGRSFVRADLTSESLPDADAILCRDCLIHLSLPQIRRALENICGSSAKILMTTTFIGGPNNWEIASGAWRPIDLCSSPFGLPQPAELIVEHPRYLGFGDKALGVWRVDDIRPRMRAPGACS
jgi:SAM-dependent methyltransferase